MNNRYLGKSNYVHERISNLFSAPFKLVIHAAAHGFSTHFEPHSITGGVDVVLENMSTKERFTFPAPEYGEGLIAATNAACDWVRMQPEAIDSIKMEISAKFLTGDEADDGHVA